MKPKKFDVVSLGTVAVDEIIVVESYPAPDSKVRVLQAERQCGGLTAIALIAAARLGATCAYAGVLGRDELSQFVIAQMENEKIDLHFLRRRENAPPVHSFIIVDSGKHTRNVFSHRAVPYRVGANWPPKELIESARVLFVDHADLKAMIRAATIARKAGVPVVADLERVSGDEFSKLLALVDHLILSWKFAKKLTGKKKPSDILRALWSKEKRFVAVTYGKRGCWFLDDSGKIKHQPIFPVDVVDTTGCGDVFHGAYAAALAQNHPPDERVRIATAAAALQATRLGGQAGIPTRAELTGFLRQRNKHP